MNLGNFNSRNFNRGRPAFIEALWIVVSELLFSTFLPGSWWRAIVLRAFGAKLGEGVVIKPHVSVKFPWRLEVGDRSWIGERAWIDNLAKVRIGHDCCVSQGAYVCTGNHDWSRSSFDLRAEQVTIGNYVWVGAMSRIGPGVNISDGVVITLGTILTHDAKAWSIYSGSPAALIKSRKTQALDVANAEKIDI